MKINKKRPGLPHFKKALPFQLEHPSITTIPLLRPITREDVCAVNRDTMCLFFAKNLSIPNRQFNFPHPLLLAAPIRGR